jgi:methylisocitrate lyase
LPEVNHVTTGPARLRALVSRKIPAVAALALDPLSAKTAAAAGLEALYIGGGALGYVKTFTEANLTLPEMVDVAIDIRAACDLPLVLDGTCGWGDPMHLGRTISLAEAAGFAAIEIEDQLLPKRAHHHVGVEHLIPADLMAAKIEAAVSARKNRDFIIIARTNACRTDDLETALQRAEAYRQAGADMLLVLPKSPDQAAAIALRIDAPLVYMTRISSMEMSLAEAGRLGYRLVIDAMTPLLARQRALRQCYWEIASGVTEAAPGDAYETEVQIIHDLIGLDQMLAVERRTVEGLAYRH